MLMERRSWTCRLPESHCYPNVRPRRPLPGTGIVLRAIVAGSLSLLPVLAQTSIQPPQFVDLTPAYSSNVAQTFSVTFRDPNGYGDLSNLYMNINQLQVPYGGCFIEFNLSNFTFGLLNDAGTSYITGSTTLQNSQCSVNVSSSQIALNGTDARLTFTITASPSFFGKKTVYLNAVDRSLGALEWAAYGNWYPGISGVLVNRYRLFSPYSSSHLHTIDPNEYNYLKTQGFIDEGVPGRVFSAPSSGGTASASPIYRLYFKAGVRHFWTTDRNEYLTLLSNRTSYTGEGADGFILPTQLSGSIPLYRLVFCCQSPIVHHWTTDLNEASSLLTRGWALEGVVGWMYPPVSGAQSVAGPVSALAIDTVLNAASQQSSSVAANQAVRILGRGFGSRTQSIYASLGGKPLRVLSVRDEELIAVTPEDLPAAGAAVLEVVVNGARRTSTDVATARVNPAIFTDGPSGMGHAMAERRDGGITVYVTGIGAGNLSAWLNGLPAQVLSAESVAGMPGVTAVTLALPQGLDGDHASLSLKIGEAYTQPGVSVSIR